MASSSEDLMHLKSASIIVLLLSQSCPPALSQDGRTLFRKMQDALGGAERIAAVQDFEQCVRGDTWGNNGRPRGVVYKRTRWIKPNVLRLDQVGPDDSYVLYFNGSSGWEILPDKGFAELAGEELEFARGYANGVDLRSWLADRDSNNVFTASAPAVITISTEQHPTHKTEITLDPITFLPVKVASSHPAGTQIRQFEGSESVQGIKFPRRIINFHNGKKLADASVEETRVNIGFSPEDLEVKPQGLKPVMSDCRSK